MNTEAVGSTMAIAFRAFFCFPLVPDNLEL
jgi:hypothetical protein